MQLKGMAHISASVQFPCVFLDHKHIPKAFNHLTLVTDIFACSVFLFVDPNPRSLTEERVFSLCTQCAVSVSSCFPLSLSTWMALGLFFFSDTFCACRDTACSSDTVTDPWHLNGIRQMWSEHQFTGHWSGSVISPSTSHAVCDCITDWRFVH